MHLLGQLCSERSLPAGFLTHATVSSLSTTARRKSCKEPTPCYVLWLCETFCFSCEACFSWKLFFRCCQWRWHLLCPIQWCPITPALCLLFGIHHWLSFQSFKSLPSVRVVVKSLFDLCFCWGLCAVFERLHILGIPMDLGDIWTV